jgi:LacI family transcriptional regulator
MSIVLFARDLGLSISTVSRALNGYTDVAPETRRRIIERAQQIGYRPNPGARRLKSGKTSAIGVVLPPAIVNAQAVDSMYSTLLGGVEIEIEPAGYHLFATIQAKQDDARELALYKNFIKGGWVDALVIVRTRVHDSRIELAQKEHLPFISYGRTQSSQPYAWVDPDNEQAFYLITRRQIDFGHTRIALLNGSPDYSFSKLRQQGYLRALAESGIAPDPLLMLHGELTEMSGYALCRSLIVTAAQPPTAILCATDSMAIGAIAACRERGLVVGKDISIVGYGNYSASEFCNPPLTTVDHQVFENGRHIGQSLLRLLGGTKPADIHYLEPVVVVARKSDGPRQT